MIRVCALIGALVVLPAGGREINTAYRIDGDPQAAPIQAFDDGDVLYLQLRNPAEPPVPLGPSGPIAYRVYGPYLELPVLAQVTLAYGPYTASVRAAGRHPDALPDVVSVTRPVDALDPPPPPRAPRKALAPSPRPPAPVMPVLRHDSEEVVGTISVDTPQTRSAQAEPGGRAGQGEAGNRAAGVAGQPTAATDKRKPAASLVTAAVAKPAPKPAPKPASKPAAASVTKKDSASTASAAQRRDGELLVSYEAAARPETYRGKADVLLRADGTVAGASAALAALDACQAAGVRCGIDYAGGRAGVLTIMDAAKMDAAKNERGMQ